MKHKQEHIEHFIANVKKRLNRHLSLSVFIGSLVIGGAVMTIIALSYILRGYHVPLWIYPAVFSTALLLGCCYWIFRQLSHDQAARFADLHFKLKDSIRSYSGFHKSGKNEGFYKLQAEQTEKSLDGLTTKGIRYHCPTCMLAIAVVLVLSSGLMGFKQDSPEVRLKKQQETLTLESTEEINRQIKDALEQLAKQLDEKELEKIVDVNVLKEKVEQLKETPDIKDAMRQYAQLEKDLGDILSSLKQQKEEQLLDRMGKQLQKDDESKALGNQLTQKQYDSASKELEKYKIDPQAELEMQQEQLEKLKTMAGRMAEEAGRNESGQSQQTGQSGQQTSQSESRASQLAKQLNQSAAKANDALQQAMRQMQQTGQQSEQSCQACQASQQAAQNANQSLGNMGQYLQQLSAKRQAQSMMQQMLNSLSQGQQGLGQCQQCNGNMPGAGQNNNGQRGDGAGQGGREAGIGAGSARNTEPGKDAPNGPLTQVQGIQGTGPSQTSTEESGAGSDTGNAAKVRENLQYQQQVESFVRREDVPEAVKAGVKAYFENIHNATEGN